mmetsp:Transcript_5302/g.13395  ORF Transcript_5302/g.13395 Transcript_5302/m.13395 type:complete len:283 (+) Transcript_5302:1093-1941(+)
MAASWATVRLFSGATTKALRRSRPPCSAKRATVLCCAARLPTARMANSWSPGASLFPTAATSLGQTLLKKALRLSSPQSTVMLTSTSSAAARGSAAADSSSAIASSFWSTPSAHIFMVASGQAQVRLSTARSTRTWHAILNSLGSGGLDLAMNVSSTPLARSALLPAGSVAKLVRAIRAALWFSTSKLSLAVTTDSIASTAPFSIIAARTSGMCADMLARLTQVTRCCCVSQSFFDWTASRSRSTRPAASMCPVAMGILAMASQTTRCVPRGMSASGPESSA